MRLFKSSNKSSASLDRLSGSRDHSPTQQPDPTFAHAQGYNGPPASAYPPPPQFQHQQPPQQQQLQKPEAYYHETPVQQQHPAHTLSRTQSSRAAAGVGEAYGQDQQPTVNIVPPANIPLQQNQYVAGQTQFGQSQTVRTDKEEKKSKRGIFGFKSHGKEESSDRRSVGRASSILKKGAPQSPLQTSPRAPSSQYSEPRSGGLDERFSNESLPQDSEQYNRYHESQDQYRPQDQYESPSSQHTRQSVQYVEDSRYQPQHPHHPSTHSQNHPQNNPSDRQYPVYPIRGSPNSSEHNLPYQGSRASASTYDQHQSLRPPSQTSLGPPSPLIAQSQHDSRPSTSNTQQQRYSTQSQQQHIQQPQPQHLHQQGHSLPLSQQPTPQPTPQPQTTQAPPQQQQSQQPPVTPTQTSGTSNMPRNETANGRRHEEHLYSQQDPRIRTQSHEQSTQGRSTPPPSSRNREDLGSLDYSELRAKLEELQAKYSKVKRYYFEREAQVTQLQNTVANQRLSMSKTSLDDAGYTARFERLNGAIQNLSFNIRKDWRRIPNWLAPVCNRDAHSVGTKEMTAVGRACITRWLYESIFERIFHPGIDPNLSMHLKNIERTLRRGQYAAAMTSEQQDDLLTKITTWRLTTVEGLQDILSSRQSEMYTETLVMSLVKQLESYLRAFLNDPPPAGLADGLASIIGLTVGIAQNIPLESRDICIEYFMPGSHITDAYMKLEPGMTALAQPGSAPTATDALPVGNDNEDQISAASSQLDTVQSMNVEDAIRESAKAASALGQGPSVQRHESISSATTIAPKLQQQTSSASSKEKKGFLGGFVNKKPTLTPSRDSDQSKGGDAPPDHHYTLQSLTNGTTENKIRFAAFLAVEVRGRNVLKETSKEAEKSANSSKDLDDKKDALSGVSGGGGATSSGAGVQKNSANATAANILCKASVYAFE